VNVRIYTTPTCGYCHQTKGFLDQLGVKYTEHDVSREHAAAEEMVRLTGQMGVPVIVVDDEVIIGFDRARLQQLLVGGDGQRHPRLGLKVADASRAGRKPGEPPLFGAVVVAVAPSSPAKGAGLKAGDIITSIGGRRINNAAELEEVAGALVAGTNVRITFYRGEGAIHAEFVL
jgi:glutaredoxin 3